MEYLFRVLHSCLAFDRILGGYLSYSTKNVVEFVVLDALSFGFVLAASLSVFRSNTIYVKVLCL